MRKQAILYCLIIALLLPGCQTIQSWLPGGNPSPTETSIQQTPPLPDSSNLVLPDELKTTATAIASDATPRVASAHEVSNVIYNLQAGTPVAVANFSHPDQGCDWMGVGGQVFNAHSEPVLFLVVEVGGELNGASVSALSLTGSAAAWGPGGYEIKLSDRVTASNGTVWVQFYDLGGTPVSDRVYLITYQDCNQNAILVNMVQPQPPPMKFYFPIIMRNTAPTP